MRLRPSTTLLFALPILSFALASAHAPRSHMVRRAPATEPSVLSGKTFDYVVVGGGTAGLSLAVRLSEGSATVAVVEAGSDGSEVMDDILMPAQAYYNGLAKMTSAYDWHYQGEPQSSLGGRAIYWPRGKVLGGSSAVNGGYMTRASKIEHDSWASLTNSSSVWGWDVMEDYYQRSETYTLPTSENAQLAGVISDASSHNTTGPIHNSYPAFFFPQTTAWVPTFKALGIDTRDPAGGDTSGAYISPSCIDPAKQARSYAKNGYYDPIESTRSNLVVLTDHQATRILFDGTKATGVEFAASASGPRHTVLASKEVILAAGVIGSPQLLQVSGVGPAALLESLDIDVIVNLSGVGYHLTDHLKGQITFQASDLVEYTGDQIVTNATYAANQKELWKAGDPTSLYTSPNDAVAYVDLFTLFGEKDAALFVEELALNMTAAVEGYTSSAEVQAGYRATYEAELGDVIQSTVGQAEILFGNTGAYGAYKGHTINVQAAIQHPLSRGSVTINSTSTFDQPIIQPNYFSHPADIIVMRQAFKFARKVASTAPLSEWLGDELEPSLSVTTDEEWEEWIRSTASTEYHPASSCSMLPREQGGVVDPSMRVYGVSNLRIVDTSIIPVGFSAHLMSPAYAIAERAHDLILSTSAGIGGSDNTGDHSGSSTPTGSSEPVETSASSPSPTTSFLLAIGALAVAALCFF